METIPLADLLKGKSKSARKMIRDGQTLTRQLRENGVEAASYGLAGPQTRRPGARASSHDLHAYHLPVKR